MRKMIQYQYAEMENPGKIMKRASRHPRGTEKKIVRDIVMRGTVH